MNSNLQMYIPSQYSITVSHPLYHGAMEGRAKRKWCEVNVEDSYVDQRLSVMNTSIIKLKNQPAKRSEPSLRRSLLIFNTLKHIESEIGVNSSAKHSNIGQKLFADNQESTESIPSKAEGSSLGMSASQSDKRYGWRCDRTASSDAVPETANLSNVIAMDSETTDIPVADVNCSSLASSGTSDNRLISYNDQSKANQSTDLPEPGLSTGLSCSVVADSNCRAESDNSNFNFDELFPIFDYSYDLDFLTTQFSSTDSQDQFCCTRSVVGSQEQRNSTCGHRNELLLDDFDRIMEVLVGN